jgi:hypothetical protein
VIDNPGTSGAEASGTINLPLEGKYPFRVVYEYLTNPGARGLTVSWTPPGVAKQVIPAARIFRYDQTFYYLKTGSAGNDPTLASAWTTSPNGANTGVTPSNFTAANKYYVFANRASSTVSTNWAVSGAGSRIIVGPSMTVTFTGTVTERLESNAGAIINFNNATMPTAVALDPTSTANFNVPAATAIPLGTYGHVNFTQSQQYTLPVGLTQILGNLYVAGGATVVGANNNFSTVKVGGDVSFHNPPSTLPIPALSTTSFALGFTGAKDHTVTFDNPVDPGFYSIATDPGDVVTFVNAGTHTYTVGTAQGGGLANRGTLDIGSNNLVVTNFGAININGETGDIAMSGGNFTLNSTGVSSSIYFNSLNHDVNNLNITLPSASTASIQSTVNIGNLVSVSSGNINGGDGFLTLRSDSLGTARIAPLTGTSRIAGSITTQRYMEGEGQIFRYISMPVKGVKVSDLQAFFPITGNFTGHDVIPNTTSGPSLLYYNEPGGGYKQFPPVGGTNQDTLRTSVGYSAYIREGTIPTNWQVKGAPNQGNITYTLTPSTTPSNGYNLVGNPYPAPI